MKKMKTIGRQELSEALSRNLGFSPQKSAQVLEAILEEITSHLVFQRDVKFSCFGKFIVQEKKGRMGRNPKTGDFSRLLSLVWKQASYKLNRRVL